MKTLALLILLSAVAPTHANGPDYDDYAAVLSARVDTAGRVDYAALAASPERLNAVASALADVSRDRYETWNEDGKIAFWINAYNALTLKLIADNYPLEGEPGSIRDIPGAWDAVTFTVMGKGMTLDHIEHGILRAAFAEPRIHMALVCAAVSCPPLRREPYRGESLGAALDEQVRRFLASPRGLVIDREAGAVRLSAVFDWFAADFVKQYQGSGGKERAAIEFVSRYVSPGDRRFLETGEYTVTYLDYDWTLNGQAK